MLNFSSLTVEEFFRINQDSIPQEFTDKFFEDQEVNSIEQAIAILVQAGYKVTLEKIN